MIRVSNIKISPDRSVKLDADGIKTALKGELLKKLRIGSERLKSFTIFKQSIDARKKDDVKIVFSVDISITDEKSYLKRNREKDICEIENEEPSPGVSVKNNTEHNDKVIIVGCGPAGLFCALRLAEEGFKPLLLERGEEVDKRKESVNKFWENGILNTSSNVQFGEGGAGTFSDGKLNTLVKDRDGYQKEVYRIFTEFGADREILYVNKPHIGTDRLCGIVKKIRERIIELGGEVRFSSTVADLRIEKGRICAVILENGTTIECDRLVLALGHSARDTFRMLKEKGLAMEQKPFAMGLRVQHPKDYIDRLQYGEYAKVLPAADYKVTYNADGERSVYSFCMCPGGYVVNASSEKGRLAVNGMSYSGRDGRASNSAIVVQISTSDFPDGDVLAGVALQRELEERAFKACNGKIPVQTLKSFSESIKNSDICSKTDFFTGNAPECKGKYEFADISSYLPGFMIRSYINAFPHFGSIMKGFDSPETLLLGLESRTSSPVRILRNEKLECPGIKGVYPCGEGAGYAGGITSAAMDGLRVAMEITKVTNNL